MNLDLQQHQVSPWWKYCYNDLWISRQIRIIVKLLLNVQRRGRTICFLCDRHRLNTAHHLLFECPSVDALRCKLWTIVEDSSPPQFKISMQTMPDKKKCMFILNAFNVPYVQEWKSIYDSVSDFIYRVCLQYDKLCTNE